MTEIVAIAACIILIGLVVFQVFLIVGAPLGRYAWGGAHRILPLKLRIASLTSLLLYFGFAFIILSKVGIVSSPLSQSFIDVAVWVLTAYFALGVAMNAVSRSNDEKRVMTPVAFALTVLFLHAAIG